MTGICLVKFALLSLADSPLIVLMDCFLSLLLLQLLLLLLPLLLLVLVILLHSVGLLLLKLLLCRSLLTFRLFPSLLFGCLLFNQILLCDFFSLVFLAGLFFHFLIFYHFFTFRHFNSKTNAHFCACFYPILCFFAPTVSHSYSVWFSQSFVRDDQFLCASLFFLSSGYHVR